MSKRRSQVEPEATCSSSIEKFFKPLPQNIEDNNTSDSETLDRDSIDDEDPVSDYEEEEVSTTHYHDVYTQQEHSCRSLKLVHLVTLII